jgi:hypothetical protein
MTEAHPVRIEIAVPEFFSSDPKRLTVEENPIIGRTYFLKRGRIVAVAIPTEGERACD